MSGTPAGGAKAKAKNLATNPDYYKDLGKIGGKFKSPKKGFGSMTPEQRKAAGSKGGTNSRKGKK